MIWRFTWYHDKSRIVTSLQSGHEGKRNMLESNPEKHLATAEHLLNGIGIGNTGHIHDVLDVMVRDTVKKSTDMALVKESLGTGFRLGSDFRERDPDFIDIAAAVNKRCEPLKQIAWLLEVEVPWEDIRSLLREAITNIRRAQEFIKAFQDRELSNTEREYLEQNDFPGIQDLNDQFEIQLDTYVRETFQSKMSNYYHKRSMNWDIVRELVEERATEINKRGPVEQVAWLFRTGYSEQLLMADFKDAIADRNEYSTKNEETPEP